MGEKYGKNGWRSYKRTTGKITATCTECLDTWTKFGDTSNSVMFCKTCWESRGEIVGDDGTIYQNGIKSMVKGSWYNSLNGTIASKLGHSAVHALGCGKSEGDGASTSTNFSQ